MSVSPLAFETVWSDKSKFEDAERAFHERRYKLHWMNSSSKMGEPKSDPKADGPKIDVKENIPIDIKKMETIINTQPQDEKSGKEAKKNDKGAAKATEKKELAPDDAKIGEKGKKKNKEDDAKDKDKQKQKKPKEGKKKEEKTGDENKKNGIQENTLEDLKSKDETSSEGVEAKKGSKKPKKTKNKKNQPSTGEESTEGSNKKSEKKEPGSEQTQKKKADKRESKKDVGGGGAADSEILTRLLKLEAENKKFRSMADDIKKLTSNFNQLISRMTTLEKGIKGSSNSSGTLTQGKTEEKSKKKSDDDVDLFGSDEEEDAEMLKIKAERLKMYEEKKAKKPGVIAKSNVILDVKPWDDETSMKTMEDKVRQVACDGLLWGASKLVPLAFGIHKLQISCVIEDEKVSVDWLQEQIEANEDLVQSVDVAAFNKV